MSREAKNAKKARCQKQPFTPLSPTNSTSFFMTWPLSHLLQEACPHFPTIGLDKVSILCALIASYASLK